MILYKLKPTSPGIRHKNKILKVFKKNIFKNLSKNIIYKSGRNSSGKITVRHKGGRKKIKYRFIDFYRFKDNIKSKVLTIEYDPNRNCNISLIVYKDGEKRYIISPKNLKVGDELISGIKTPLKIGNSLRLINIPEGFRIHCLELNPGKGAQFLRSAGSYGIINSKSKNYSMILLKSGKIKKFNNKCRATIGEVGNDEYNLLNFGKAGYKRLKGIRPTVRGVAMNPVDHPHGGGEGKTSGGRDPVSPWGVLSKGCKKKL